MKLNISSKNTLKDEGAWFDFYESKVKVAHISNLRFQRALLQAQQPYRKKMENGTLDPAISKQLLCKAMSEAILLDWKDVENDAGPLQYSTEAGYQALMNNDEFRDFVSEVATNYDLFKQELVDEVGKS